MEIMELVEHRGRNTVEEVADEYQAPPPLLPSTAWPDTGEEQHPAEQPEAYQASDGLVPPPGTPHCACRQAQGSSLPMGRACLGST